MKKKNFSKGVELLGYNFSRFRVPLEDLKLTVLVRQLLNKNRDKDTYHIAHTYKDRIVLLHIEDSYNKEDNTIEVSLCAGDAEDFIEKDLHK